MNTCCGDLQANGSLAWIKEAKYLRGLPLMTRSCPRRPLPPRGDGIGETLLQRRESLQEKPRPADGAVSAVLR